jgi:hypothetical protein
MDALWTLKKNAKGTYVTGSNTKQAYLKKEK